VAYIVHDDSGESADATQASFTHHYARLRVIASDLHRHHAFPMTPDLPEALVVGRERQYLSPVSRLAEAMLAGVLVAASPALAGAAPGSGPTDAFRSTCERRLTPTQVTVESTPGKVVKDLTRSIAELTRMQQGSDGPAPPARAIGLTRASYQFDSSVRVNTITDPETRLTCMRPRIDVTLSVAPQTVYVAREFPPGSCGHEQILEHEQRHVEVNQKHVEAAAELLQEEMTSFYGDRIMYGDAQTLTDQVFNDVENRWTQVARRRFEKGNDEHRAIDSPESDRRYRSLCDGELSKG
jgi:hypothetical protein